MIYYLCLPACLPACLPTWPLPASQREKKSEFFILPLAELNSFSRSHSIRPACNNNPRSKPIFSFYHFPIKHRYEKNGGGAKVVMKKNCSGISWVFPSHVKALEQFFCNSGTRTTKCYWGRPKSCDESCDFVGFPIVC